MSIEEIIKSLTSEADVCEELAAHTVDIGVKQMLEKKTSAFREAIDLLKTHPDAQPNEPLTLEELREMEGWPVWTVTKGISDPGRWELVIDAECEDRLEMAERADGFYEIDTDSYGKTWLAYRRPPKEATS